MHSVVNDLKIEIFDTDPILTNNLILQFDGGKEISVFDLAAIIRSRVSRLSEYIGYLLMIFAVFVRNTCILLLRCDVDRYTVFLFRELLNRNRANICASDNCDNIEKVMIQGNPVYQ